MFVAVPNSNENDQYMRLYGGNITCWGQHFVFKMSFCNNVIIIIQC